MIELPIEPANTPARCHVVDWTERYALIKVACAMRAKRKKDEALVDQARSDALQRIEHGIAESLQRGGTHPEAAAALAFAFVDRCVAFSTAGR